MGGDVPDAFRLPPRRRRAGSRSTQDVDEAKRAQGRVERLAGRASGSCNIKGNRNRKGQWIYHVPGMPYYDQTRAEEVFCTEAEARAAGYRRAIVR